MYRLRCLDYYSSSCHLPPKIAIILVYPSCKIAKECPFAMLANSSTFNAVKFANASGIGCVMAAWLFVVFLHFWALCAGDFHGVKSILSTQKIPSELKYGVAYDVCRVDHVWGELLARTERMDGQSNQWVEFRARLVYNKGPHRNS